MTGRLLYPLNTLKQIHPEIYHQEVKKYQGRERLLLERIPPLDCLWNDVLHLTAVEPRELKDKLAKAGLPLSSRAWCKIPISRVMGKDSVAFTYQQKIKTYEPFDPTRMNIYKNIPEEAVQYYRQMKSEGKKPLLFHLVPHILYRGSIDTTDLEMVRMD